MNLNFDGLKTAEKIPNAAFNNISEEDFLRDIEEEGGGTQQQQQTQAGQWNEPQQQQQQQQPTFDFISPEVAIGVIDSIIPAVIVWAYAMFMQRKLKPSVFHLTAAEKRTLEPIIKECLKTINVDTSKPFQALMIVGGMIYGGKFFMIEPEDGEAIGKREAGGGKLEDGKRGRGRPRKS